MNMRRAPQVIGPRGSYVRVGNAVAGSSRLSHEDFDEEPLPVDEGYTGILQDSMPVPGAPRHTARVNKAIEYDRWNETIPALVEPYAYLMMVTDMMRNPITSSSALPLCSCNKSKVSVVSLIYLDSKLVSIDP